MVFSVAEIVCWRCETGCCAAETSGRIVAQVGSVVNEIEDSVLHDLQVGGGGRSVHWKGWGWFFWLVQLQRSNQWDLRNGIERWNAGALVLWFVVLHDGAGADGWRDVGEAGGVVRVAVAVASVGFGEMRGGVGTEVGTAG